MKDKYKVIVVGSGPGGSMTAINLLKAGVEVLLLEKGEFSRMGDVKEYSFSEMTQKYNNGGLTTTLGKSRINYVEASCFGGGSEINSGLYHRLPKYKFNEWRRDFGLDYENSKLLEIYNEIEKRINISFSDGNKISEASKKLFEGSQKLGLNCIEVPRWIKSSKNGIVKQSMTETYLNEYIDLGGSYLCSSSLEKIVKSNNKIELEVNINNKIFNFKCETVFLCMGAVHSPFTLRKSGIKKHIGSTLKLHPSFKFIAQFDKEINTQDMGVPVHQIKGDHNYSMGCSISSKGYLGLVLNDTGNFKKIEKWKNMASYYVMISPYGYGKVRAHPFLKSPVIYYKLLKKDYENLQNGIQVLGNVLLEAGASSLYPSYNNSMIVTNKVQLDIMKHMSMKNFNLMSVHLFSSLRMGKNKNQFATNPYGKLWNENNIFINDGSILCDSPGVNPQGTILAFAKYNIDNFINNNIKNEI
tara:strand:- start:9601 stop:11010 length:1410 start_codon:yes stop_codon:yes gene_type:complete